MARCQVVGNRIERVSVVPCPIDEHSVPRPVRLSSDSPVTRFLEETSAEFGTRFRPEGGELMIGYDLPATEIARKTFVAAAIPHEPLRRATSPG